jgi:hypothetical protein
MSVEHFFLTCNIYTEHRIQLFRGMKNVCFEIDIGNILNGGLSGMSSTFLSSFLSIC